MRDAKIKNCTICTDHFKAACVTLHYAQETFEGMKAYRTAEGKIQLFHPEMNAKRMINSNARLCMPGSTGRYVCRSSKSISKSRRGLGTVRAGNFFIYQTVLCLQQKVLLECIWQLHINSWSSAVR